MNTGDFVESCTAIAEHFDGRLELIHWGLLETERAALPTVISLPLPESMPEPAENMAAHG